MVRDPKTKADLLNRILSIDFDGDLRHLGPSVRVQREKPNRVLLQFDQSGAVYSITVSRPRQDHERKEHKTPTAKGRRGRRKPRSQKPENSEENP